MGLGFSCFGAAAAGRKVSPDARRSGESPEAHKDQQRVVKQEKVKHVVEVAGKEKKRDHEKAAVVMRHQFPFHSRPGLL